MWKMKAVIEDSAMFPIIFSKDYCLAQETYPSKYVKGVSIPTLELISMRPAVATVWTHTAEVEGHFYREFYGDVYCTVDNKNLYKADPHSGLTLFMEGTTRGRFLGPNTFLYVQEVVTEDSSIQTTVVTVDTKTKNKLWERPIPEDRHLFYGCLLPVDADVIMLRFNSYDGFDILCPIDGSTLWSISFPVDYRLQGDAIATQDHVIYVLHRDEGTDIFNVVLDTKIYVHKKYSGEIVRVIDDVPFHYGHLIHYQFSSGILYGAHCDDLYAIDPVNGQSFSHYKVNLGCRSSCLKIIGEMDSKVILFMDAEKDREISTAVVNFDTDCNEITYKQHFDNFFHRRRNIEVNKGFLFITDRNAITHIYEWVPD